jgi:hypothetical protein
MPDQEKSAVGSEEELIIGQELKLADRLALKAFPSFARPLCTSGVTG